MKGHLLYCLDYHHGQATRVIAGGVPHLPGRTMAEKEDHFRRHLDHVRAASCQEPRGHRQMLGVVITAPARSDCEAGLIFLHPGGYFAMCGDSLFSAVTGMVETGVLAVGGTGRTAGIDTVAGRVEVEIALSAGGVDGITMDNVPSYPVTSVNLDAGRGKVQADIAYGGLYYAFVSAADAGIGDLTAVDPATLIETGTYLWQRAREDIRFTDPWTGRQGRVDLVTLWQETGPRVHRVANFYGPGTMGRTPSGTGLSARLSLEASAGRLEAGQDFFHESPLGLRFRGRVRIEDRAIIPRVTARSYLMGINILTLEPDDPFRGGFVL